MSHTQLPEAANTPTTAPQLDLNDPQALLLFCAHLIERAGNMLEQSPDRARCAESAEWLCEVVQDVDALIHRPLLRLA